MDWPRDRFSADFDARACSGGDAASLGFLLHKVDRLLGVEKHLSSFFRHRASEEITLRKVTPLIRQPIEIGVGFDTLRRRLQAEARAELDDSVDEFGPLAPLREICNVALVDLQLVELQFLEVMQARITGPEIIQGNSDAQVLQ